MIPLLGRSFVMPDLSVVGMTVMCSGCMRGNVDDDRNFCEKNILVGTCSLDTNTRIVDIMGA